MTPQCVMAGCARPAPGGGRCATCDVLFGPYQRLIDLDDVHEWQDPDEHDETAVSSPVARRPSHL